MEVNTKEMAGTNYQTLESNHDAIRGLASGVSSSFSNILVSFITIKCQDMK